MYNEPIMALLDISIHALREESDASKIDTLANSLEFQSTLSVRRATKRTKALKATNGFQSTLSVRRATG